MSVSELPGPADLDGRQRAAVESVLFALADDEFVLAERYAEWQVRAPTLESDLAVANIAQDELGHARLWYDLLQDFGYTEADLVFERDPADFRHATLVELPIPEGGWADTVVRSYLYDVAEHLRLEALEASSYPRIADRIAKVRGEEEYHREHAQNWLERLCDDGTGRDRVEAAVDRLFPYALALFEPTEHEADVVDLGVRPERLADLRDDWLDITVPFLESLGVRTPVTAEGGDDAPPLDVLLPDERGRDGTHTEHWPALHDELTHTYRMLDRTETTTIMDDPDDAE